MALSTTMSMNRMPARIFADAGAWIAYFNQRDQYHAQAVAIYNRIAQQSVELFTTDYVMDEAVTRLKYDAHHAAAVRFLDFIHAKVDSVDLKLEKIEDEVFKAAESFFRRYATARLSFTDCTSFVICQKRRITDVFGFDRHFNIMKMNLLTE